MKNTRALRYVSRAFPTRVFQLVLISVSVAAVHDVSGQGTLLDPSFGGSGKVSSHILAFNSWGNDAVLQPDGKIVVVGAGNNDLNFPGGFQAGVIRFNSDGTLDSTFDGDGRVGTVVESGKVSEATAVARQADGKIVVTGILNSERNAFGTGFIIRYNPNGSLDTSFNGNGIKKFTFGIDAPFDIAVQSDGKIVIVEQNAAPGLGGGILIARFNSDGSLDSGFNGTGFVRILTGAFLPSEPTRLAIRPDGKIVSTGIGSEHVVVQLNSDGTPDVSFGTNGVVNGIDGYALTLQADGKILIANRNDFFPQNTRQVIKRLNTDGSLDTSFGTGGSATVSFVNQDGSLAYPPNLAVQPDGKILLGGAIRLSPPVTGFDFGLARLNASGTLDNSFGQNGRVTTDVQVQDYGRSVLLQPDGKIILAGQSDGGFAVARYIPGAINFACRPVADFTGDGRSDIAYFDGPFGRWRYLDSMTGGLGSVRWGLDSDLIVPADYNGDCRTDFAVFRNGTWYITTANVGTEIYYQFGSAGDVPVPGDYDGDDLADPAVFRNGIWYIFGTRDGFSAIQFGLAGDKPVTGDYDGDGREDIAVYRDGVWYIQRSNLGTSIVQFGLASDKPVVGDYDGDGKSDIAVYRPSEGTWYLLRSTEGFAAIRWGIATDLPVPADYDGDWRTDIAVYRNGDWYLLQSTSGYQLKRLGGNPGDRPVQNAFVP